jgi:hypothetical protein
MEETVEGMLMLDAGVGGVAAKGGDGVSNVGASTQHEVHKCAKRALEMLNVDFRGGDMDKVVVRKRGSADGVNVSHTKTL